MSVKCMFFQDSEIEEFELNDTLMNDYITAYPDEIELMQSTGLKDKNEKEVFVGDIIKCTKGCPHEVYLEKEYGGIFKGGMPAIYLKRLGEGYAWTEDEEIIGNVYENPELLEDK
ncbi:YopX protein [Streptococcus pneumoniae]|uniref:YopX protein n=2 Tax=Streptococcus pneumoniae TaxID=1313 RepID=A0A4J1X6U4_STREE|nr:phage protein [Streptococcus pneumoniae]CMU58889.1 phage protein [Streptococcus pneumoniae]CMZ14549.1 phage protein [Streptococcus pneumoniae]VIY85080.1 YopX protein [Streptococcus pneumoniae]VIZ30420.1 phage protein [Streptococcus pneumoniae]